MDNKDVNIEQVSINDTNTAAPKTETETVTETATNSDATTTAEPTNPELDALQTKITELNDKYLRVAAELENTRRRAGLDIESAARNRAMNIARQFLPVMDAADAALKHTPDDAGIQSMARALESAFAQIGIVKMDSVGTALNPMFHSAVQAIDAKNIDPAPAANTIVEELQSGYMFGDSVLRTAMVIVAK
ncbi:nucleotide exchange factor GrpE [bacterium]|nr:nucleotide exchange factor GrpE [bacterium]